MLSATQVKNNVAVERRRIHREMCKNNQQGRDLSWKRQPSDTNHQLKPSINTQIVVDTDVVAWISVEVVAAHKMQHVAEQPQHCRQHKSWDELSKHNNTTVTVTDSIDN